MSEFDDYVEEHPDESESLVAHDLPPEDRQCSEVESIRWVANNISRVDVSPADCPSAIGWTLLLECRTNPDFRMEFLTKMWPKLLPSRAQLDEKQEDGELDGRVTIEMVERIQGIKAAAEESVMAVKEPDKVDYQTFEDYSQ